MVPVLDCTGCSNIMVRCLAVVSLLLQCTMCANSKHDQSDTKWKSFTNCIHSVRWSYLYFLFFGLKTSVDLFCPHGIDFLRAILNYVQDHGIWDGDGITGCCAQPCLDTSNVGAVYAVCWGPPNHVRPAYFYVGAHWWRLAIPCCLDALCLQSCSGDYLAIHFCCRNVRWLDKLSSPSLIVGLPSLWG